MNKYADVEIALYCKNIENIYFESFGVDHVPNKIEKITGHKNIKTDIFRIQSNNSIMCGHFSFGFIDFMFVGKSLIDFTSLFSPCDFEKNDNIFLSYFKNKERQLY